MLSLKRTVEPTELPLSLATAKQYLRVRADVTDDDAEVSRILGAATDWCERYCRRQFVTATWRWNLPDFPPFPAGTLYADEAEGRSYLYPARRDENVIYTPRAPLQTVTIQYVDNNGTTQTLDPSRYEVDTDSAPGRIAPAYGTSWPTVRRGLKSVIVTMVNGYGAASAVPRPIGQAIGLLASHWWIHREAVALGTISREIALSLRDALSLYRLEVAT